MFPRPDRFREGARRALFVLFAACTLWLVIENSILLVVLPHMLHRSGPAVRSEIHGDVRGDVRAQARHE